jgi:ElaB/YqjD/DUF883 family membrane-anchored ribosome-binding protein
MGESPEELRRDIEEVRGDLGTTLDQIGDRVSPKQMVRRRTQRIGQGFRNLRDAVMGGAQSVTQTTASGASTATDSVQQTIGQVADQAKQAPDMVQRQAQGNPLAAGLIAFGAGLLIASLFPASEPEQQAAATLQDAAQPFKDKAVEAGQELKSNLQAAAQDAVQQVKGTAQDAAHDVRQQAQSAAEVGQHAKDAAQDVKDSRS